MSDVIDANVDQPSRVVVINDHSHSNGGTAALAILSIRQFRARGIAVTLICGDSGDNLELKELGVEIVAAGSIDLLSRSKAAAFSEGIYDPSTRALVAQTRDRLDGPEVIYHVHGWAQILSPSIFCALAPIAPRVFLHAHDTFLACPNGMFMDYQRREVCHRVPLGASCLATHCDKRSYPQKLWRAARHATLNRCLNRHAPWAGLIIINPDVTDKFLRAGYPEGLLQTVRNPAMPYTSRRIPAERNHQLVYVGRLERDKGVMDLVRSATRTGTPLRLIGDGALRKEIALNHPDVELSGWQPPDAIKEFVSDARVLVMPSYHPEPFALVIPEAIQSGLPVLVSSTALLAAEIDARGFGFAFDVFDGAAFDAAVVRIRDMDKNEVREMSIRGHLYGTDLSTTPNSWSESLVDLYIQALARRGTAA